MQIAHRHALGRSDLIPLLLGPAAGTTAATVLWVLDVVQPWSLVQAAAYAGCGGLAVHFRHRISGRAGA